MRLNPLPLFSRSPLSLPLVPQGVERFQSYPPWAEAMAYLLLVVAFLPLPIVFITEHFNLPAKFSGKLLVLQRRRRST